MKYKHALGWMLARIRFLCSCQVDLLQCNHARIGGRRKSSVLQEAIWLPHLNISKGSRRLADSPIPTLFIRIVPDAGCRFHKAEGRLSRDGSSQAEQGCTPAVQPP
jgi:hypothetical protein